MTVIYSRPPKDAPQHEKVAAATQVGLYRLGDVVRRAAGRIDHVGEQITELGHQVSDRYCAWIERRAQRTGGNR